MKYRFFTYMYAGLAILFLLSVTAQFVIAGMAVFISPLHWGDHTFFIHLFGFNVPLLMFVLAWLAKLPGWAYLQLFGVMSLVFVMYFTANMSGKLPLLTAMHPMIGTGLLFVACWKVFKLYHYMKKEQT
ncbi:DUF6220 domain-containing protein [Gracilibacillus caseinilyticus]|uniref:DUF6220 domain-containing protein n=1 Tax=Gracilibacillus caseinilyticus TaxID=2932256 RepID=A0ABY4EVW8_9BACI|nr:DUF6220 domain-containing protein [Gracilibacillus caseinilyticus]UOQ48562.1 DUF6220 domain-containing protein [Gracilibacillus caseinilyticus]